MEDEKRDKGEEYRYSRDLLFKQGLTNGVSYSAKIKNH